MIRRFESSVGDSAPTGVTNTYLVGDPGVLVDPASDDIAEMVEGTNVDHAVVTHTHPDHVGGMVAVEEALDTTIWARYGRVERFERETGVEPDRTFESGDELGDSGVTVIDAPGHAPDHVVFRREATAVVGDIARAEGSVMVGTPDGDMRAYLTTLRRLRQVAVERAYPGHGPPIKDPTDRFEQLLAHRLMRERRIEAAVNDGAKRVKPILDSAYEKDLEGKEELASRTVRAHLEKLAVEGRVRWDGEVGLPP
ncbi:MAG: MBL fold metallo-hydrolase [Halodesulfurarchaeum sp.]